MHFTHPRFRSTVTSSPALKTIMLYIHIPSILLNGFTTILLSKFHARSISIKTVENSDIFKIKSRRKLPLGNFRLLFFPIFLQLVPQCPLPDANCLRCLPLMTVKSGKVMKNHSFFDFFKRFADIYGD